MIKVIDVNNLNYKYQDITILENISFHVNKGDYIGIIGPNGSGKTTIVKLILGILKAQHGQIKVLGQEISKFDQWPKIGYISQKASSFNMGFPATVEEVLAAGIHSKNKIARLTTRKSQKQKIYEALEIVGMQDYKNKMIGKLSGGQQQRIFIARSLINNPEILILDEPMAGVDTESEEAVYCLLARLNSKLGITNIMVTHDIGAITVHANKIACLANKKIYIQDATKGVPINCFTRLYNYDVTLHSHTHVCSKCSIDCNIRKYNESKSC